MCVILKLYMNQAISRCLSVSCIILGQPIRKYPFHVWWNLKEVTAGLPVFNLESSNIRRPQCPKTIRLWIHGLTQYVLPVGSPSVSSVLYQLDKVFFGSIFVHLGKKIKKPWLYCYTYDDQVQTDTFCAIFIPKPVYIYRLQFTRHTCCQNSF